MYPPLWISCFNENPCTKTTWEWRPSRPPYFFFVFDHERLRGRCSPFGGGEGGGSVQPLYRAPIEGHCGRLVAL